MKLKQTALAVLGFGIILALLGLLIPVILTHFIMASGGSVGIIGGADLPSMTFLTWQLLNGWPVALISIGITLIISAVFCLVFSKTVKVHCGLTTSIISLSLSAVGGLGVFCVFWWYAIVVFHEMSKHPIEYPVSVILGLLCFFAFVALIVMYCILRIKKWSFKGVIIDILTSIVWLPTFFLIFAFLIEKVA